MSINLPPGILRNERIIVEEGLEVVKEADGYIHIRTHRIRSENARTTTVQCMNCKDDVARYVVIEVIESDRPAEDVREINCDYATLCVKCWSDIKKNSTILNNVLCESCNH